MHKFVQKQIFKMMERRYERANEGYHPDDPALQYGGWHNNPDQRIGTRADPYLDRWFVLPKNEWPFGWLKRLLQYRWPSAPLWVHGAAQTLIDRCSFNVYLHLFHRSDEDTALHDHPWWFNVSWILEGEYDEIKFWKYNPRVYPTSKLYHCGYLPGYAHPIRRREGSVTLRLGRSPHRVVLIPRFLRGSWKRKINGGLRPVWTLFIMGPYRQTWGFYCPKRWVHWKEFTALDGGGVRLGCDAPEEP